MAFEGMSLKPLTINYKLVDLLDFIDGFQQFTVMVRINKSTLEKIQIKYNQVLSKVPLRPLFSP